MCVVVRKKVRLRGFCITKPKNINAIISLGAAEGARKNDANRNRKALVKDDVAREKGRKIGNHGFTIS
jgi:hypothetical protein